jgi:CheY-like chemotaxis protein
MSPSSASDAPAPRPSILLIDDDAISREVLSMLLEMHGYPVACAEDGAQALTNIGADQPTVILMDTQMPGLSGLDLIAALRAKTQARIVAISGSDPVEAIRHAADGFLLKPIQPEDLDALLAGDPVQSTTSNAAGIHVSASAEEEAIDPVVLGKLKAMMPLAAVREIYAAVAVDLGPRLDSLEAAMNTKDAQLVARIAHAIKGGCSMVGLTAAADAAARLETSNRIETWPEELFELRGALAALQSILSDEFPT